MSTTFLYLRLFRVHQWYKNLVIFLPIIFVGHFFNNNELFLSSLGFLALSLVSSANYTINDIRDVRKDRHHPEKKKRPIAAGKISKREGIISALILLIFSLLLASYINSIFVFFVIGLFVVTQLYTFFLKHILFADVLTIAGLFVVRAVSGAYIIDVWVSPWLIICPFFLALFLVVGKRHAEILYGNNKIISPGYTKNITSLLMMVSTTALIMSYALYSFSNYQWLLMTIPFALYVIFRFVHLIFSGSIIARQPSFVFRDIPLVVGVVLWIILTFLVIYV